MKNGKYKILCVKEITGNISENEKKVLHDWLNSADENKREFYDLKNIWASSNPAEFPLINLDAEWTELNERIRISENENKVKDSLVRKLFPERNTFIPKLKPVLVTVIVLFLAIIGIYLFNRDVPEPKLNIITTSNKECNNIQLPDGSTVYLNSGSRIEFLSLNEGTEKIFNKGERIVEG